MNRMGVVAVVLVSWVAFGAVLASNPPTTREFGIDPPGQEGTPNLPTPIDPSSGTLLAATSYEFQFVGVTSYAAPSNRGVLNHSMACQHEFAGSRMCTVAEVQRTVETPLATSYGHAWVRPDGIDGPIVAPHGAGGPQELTEARWVDCRRWISQSAADFGMVIDLGPVGECYGGVHAMACDARLPVACCAPRAIRPAAD